MAQGLKPSLITLKYRYFRKNRVHANSKIARMEGERRRRRKFSGIASLRSKFCIIQAYTRGPGQRSLGGLQPPPPPPPPPKPPLVSRSQTRPTLSPVAKPSAACSTQILYCKRGTLRTRSRTGVCETLLPDVMAPEVHHRIVATYVSSADLYYIRGGPQNCQNWAMGACPGHYCK